MISIVARILFGAVLVLGFSSCGKKSGEEREKDEILTSYRLIDEGRTEEAIYLLEKALKDHPERDEYRTVLASAYAHMAGIRIQKLVPLVVQAKQIEKTLKNQAKAKKENPSNSLHELSTLLMKAGWILDIYAKIPSVERENFKYLEHALTLLDGLGERIQAKDAAYRVVLNVIRLKYTAGSGVLQNKDLVETNQNCRINASEAARQAEAMGSILSQIYKDLMIMQPKNKTSLEGLSSRTDEALRGLRMNLEAGLPLILPTDPETQKVLMQFGITQGLTCGS